MNGAYAYMRMLRGHISYWRTVNDGVDDDNSEDNDTSHPEQPVGEDEGVDGVAGLAVPHLQYLCFVYKLV